MRHLFSATIHHHFSAKVRHPNDGRKNKVAGNFMSGFAASSFHYVGGPSNPDFVGRSLLRGMTFDITTPRQITAHLLRPYGPGLNIITYSRPPWFITFPQ